MTVSSLREKSKQAYCRLRGGVLPMMSANVINRVVLMAANMVITRMLTKQAFGVWSYVLNVYSYLGLISSFGLLFGAFQFGVVHSDDGRDSAFYQYCLRVGLWINTALSVGFILFSLGYQFAIPQSGPYIRWITPIILLEYIILILQTILRCQNRIREYAFSLNVNTVAITLGTCVGAYFGVIGVVIGRYIGNMISMVQLYRVTRAEVKQIREAGALTKIEKKELWKYSLYLGFNSTLNRMVYLVEVSILASLLQDVDQISYYKVASMIPFALTFIPSSVLTCILPAFIRNRKDRSWMKRNLWYCFAGLGAFNALICVGGVVLAPLAILILSGSAYLPAVPSFQLLMIGYFFSGTFKLMCINLLGSLRYLNFSLITSILTAVFEIGFNYWFIPQYGAVGAAAANAIVSVLISVFTMIFLVWKIWRGGQHELEWVS